MIGHPPSSTLFPSPPLFGFVATAGPHLLGEERLVRPVGRQLRELHHGLEPAPRRDRKSTRLNSSHGYISYAVFCLKKKKKMRIVRPFSRQEPTAPAAPTCPS